MSYQDIENSVSSASPVELYKFVLNAQSWRFHTGTNAISYLGETYMPEALRRSEMRMETDVRQGALELTMPRENALAALYVAAPPEGVVSVTIYRFHRGDADTIVLWKGRVGGARLSGSELILALEPIATSLRRPGLRARYQLLCRHALYSAGCGVAKASFRADGTVAAVNGTAIQIAAAASQSDGWWVGGMLDTNSGARLIVGHSADTVILVSPMPTLAIGTPVRLYAGCDHSTTTCQGRFNNLVNYGGFPYIPIKNPFAGDAIV
jgi:uncharacterized phage protein (TIGR02218 family)